MKNRNFSAISLVALTSTLPDLAKTAKIRAKEKMKISVKALTEGSIIKMEAPNS